MTLTTSKEGMWESGIGVISLYRRRSTCPIEGENNILHYTATTFKGTQRTITVAICKACKPLPYAPLYSRFPSRRCLLSRFLDDTLRPGRVIPLGSSSVLLALPLSCIPLHEGSDLAFPPRNNGTSTMP